MENQNQVQVGEDEDMDMEEIRACMLEHGIDMETGEFIHENQAKEDEETLGTQEGDGLREEEEEFEGEEGIQWEIDEEQPREEEQIKNQSVKKKVIKAPTGLKSSNKLRNVIPPRKSTAKGSARMGESIKQTDGKGAAIPKAGNHKP